MSSKERLATPKEKIAAHTFVRHIQRGFENKVSAIDPERTTTTFQLKLVDSIRKKRRYKEFERYFGAVTSTLVYDAVKHLEDKRETNNVIDLRDKQLEHEYPDELINQLILNTTRRSYKEQQEFRKRIWDAFHPPHA